MFIETLSHGYIDSKTLNRIDVFPFQAGSDPRKYFTDEQIFGDNDDITYNGYRYSLSDFVFLQDQDNRNGKEFYSCIIGFGPRYKKPVIIEIFEERCWSCEGVECFFSDDCKTKQTRMINKVWNESINKLRLLIAELNSHA